MKNERDTFSYMWAEIHMREAKVVSRIAWPDNKVVYYDTDGDGVPDLLPELPQNDPKFLQRSMENYEKFKAGIRIKIDGDVVLPGTSPETYITQADSLATDWYIVE